jgi:hypothetical protein
LPLERELFTNLMFTPECKRSLRHLFVAERATSEDC